jgi:hypothetical protein
MPIPRQDLDFQHNISRSVSIQSLLVEMRVGCQFVDIGEIVEHYCLILGGPKCFLLMSVV